MKKMRSFCDEMEDAADRQRDLPGPHPGHRRDPRPRWRSATACRAPTCGAPGVDWDLRRDQTLPMAWDKCDWKVWTHPDGDVFARVWVRLQETREATKIVDQLLDSLPSGPIMAKVPRIIKVPEGEAWVSTENPLGEMGYYVVSRGGHRAVPGEDPLGQLQQHLGGVVGAARRVRAGRHHHPRLALLHPGGHRPVTPPRREHPLLGPVAPARPRCAASRCCCPRARSSTSSSSR